MLFSICLATLIGLTWAWNQFVDTIQARTQTFFPLKEFRSPKQNINPAIFFILAFQEILLTKRHQQKIKFCLSISPLQMFGREKRAKFKQRKIQGRSVPSKRIRKRSLWDFKKRPFCTYAWLNSPREKRPQKATKRPPREDVCSGAQMGAFTKKVVWKTQSDWNLKGKKVFILARRRLRVVGHV